MNIMSAQIVFNFPLTPIGMNGSEREKNIQPILSVEHFGGCLVKVFF